MSEPDDNAPLPPSDPASEGREPETGAVSGRESKRDRAADPGTPAGAPDRHAAASAAAAAATPDHETAARVGRAHRRAIALWSAAAGALVLALTLWALPWRAEPAKAPATAPTSRTAPAPDAAAPAPIRLRGERVLRGRVIDDRKLPIGGARLRASSLDEPSALPWETTSDEAGRFVLEGLVAHALSMEVTREGHDGSERVLRADDADELVFELPRQGELLVTLRDTPGNAVEDAIVTLTGPGLWPAAQLAASATGEVLFEKLAFGEYRARARRGGRIAQPSLKVRVVPGERSQLELTMEEGAELSARVIDRITKSPIPGAELSLFDATPGVPPLLAESDAQGQVLLRGLVPGALRVQVLHAGHAPSSLDVTLPSAASLLIELDGEASISGSVVDEYGRPVVGALLSVSTREGLPVQLDHAEAAAGLGKVGELGVTQGPVPRVPLSAAAPAALGTLASQTDAQGNFRIAGLNPAPITLSAARAGYAAASLEVSDLAPHGERRNLRLVLREAGTVEGRVRDVQGRPLAGLYVSARAEGGVEQSAVTDDDGRFALHDLLGNVVVEAASSGGPALGCRLQVVPRGIARCDLTLGTALHELSLRVVDEYGFGLEGVLISVTSKAAGYRAATQVSRRDGSALLRELPDPPYRVEATLRGFLPALAEVSEIPKELKLRLTRAASLAGTVTDSLGRGVPNAFVSTDEADATTESDAHGNFLLTGVTPGALHVWAAHPSAGEGTSAELRARAGQTLPAVRIVLAGRYLPGTREDARAAHLEPPKRSDKASPARPRVKHADFELEQRGSAVIVAEVQQGGAAERQGLRAGDTLVAIDGEPVLSTAQALGMLREPPGYAAALRVVRRGEQLRLRYRRPEQ